MSNTTTERKPCTINDLAVLVGTIEALTMGDAEGKILRAQIDAAMTANKKTFHVRNDRSAFVLQVAGSREQWGIA